MLLLTVLELLLAAGLVHGAYWPPLSFLDHVRNAPLSLLRYVRNRFPSNKSFQSLNVTINRAELEMKDAQVKELTLENTVIKEQKEQFRKTLMKTKSQLGIVKKEKEVIRQHYSKIIEDLEITIANDKTILNQKLESEKIKLVETFNEEKIQLIQNHEVVVSGYKNKLVAAEKEITNLKDHFKTKINELNNNSKIEIEKLRKNLVSTQAKDPAVISSQSQGQQQNVPINKVNSSVSGSSQSQQQKDSVKNKVSSSASDSSYSSKQNIEKNKIPVTTAISSSKSRSTGYEDRNHENRNNLTDRPKNSSSKMGNSKKNSSSKPLSRKPSNSRK